MFTATHATALVIRLILTYIAANVKIVNELLSQVEVGQSLTLFQRGKLIITMSRAGGKGVLQFEFGDREFHEIKLNSAKTPISKRVLNDLEVWYHREFRPLEIEARECAEIALGQIHLERELRKFTFMDKLLGRGRTVDLNTGFAMFDRLIENKATIQPNLFGKTKVLIQSEVSLGNHAAPLRRILPVQFGASQEFTVSNGDPVDAYARSVIKSVLDLLK
ncbi:hypothetical protein pETSU_247 [Edwardsiella phage pEt-SU]|uniref:Uncharacterized protein n=1 Tax=Edwardsiella phage pEt-SU TaxID=2562142 RepID=A0A4D6DX99_9CAUD|nr:hypothetical protein HOV39_gp275 [Edwardsiella phage pEt-SU]QBZ70828.1 hypothetical protein pETSU_247 [Edwardsiella phage pEt-SU]